MSEPTTDMTVQITFTWNELAVISTALLLAKKVVLGESFFEAMANHVTTITVIEMDAYKELVLKLVSGMSAYETHHHETHG